MARSDIERKIYNAFSKTVPDVLDAVLEQCSEQKGTVVEMTEIKRKRIPILKIAAVAAAVVMLCAATVTAINFSNVIGEDEALRVAQNHVVMYEEDENIRSALAEATLLNLVYDDEIVAGEADLGLSAGRLVYNVSFKMGGYAFKVTVDAKTGVILNTEREVDENWENVYDELKEEADKKIEELKEQNEQERAEQAAKMPKIRDQQLREIFIDYFGLHQSLRSGEAWRETPWLDWDSETRIATASMKVEGYVYSCLINGDTGEVSNDSVVEDPDYTGERHLYQHIDGIISLAESIEIGEKAIGVTEEDYYYGSVSAAYYPSYLDYIEYDVDVIVVYFHLNGTLDAPYYDVIMDAKTGEVIDIIERINIDKAYRIVKEAAGIPEDKVNSGSARGGDEYEVHIESEELGKAADALLDAVTGEIIVINVYEITQKNGKPSYEVIKNQNLSTEAPDGMISEAAAAAVALENSGISEQNAWSLRVSLDSNVYTVSYLYGYDNFSAATGTSDYRTNTYIIDAKTGEILSFDALTPDDYIGEEAALAIAYRLAGISEEDTQRVTVEFQNTAMCYPCYSVVLYTERTIYRYQLDAVNGYDHIVR